MTQAFRELVQIGIALTSERNLTTLLDRILTEARRFSRAEAGTLLEGSRATLRGRGLRLIHGRPPACTMPMRVRKI